MKQTSILNQVLGPVMRGPSSSHTAGAFHLAKMARSLLGAQPSRAVIAFDPEGSYARTYAEQGADLAFAVGLLGWELTDERFGAALEVARQTSLEIVFQVRPLESADHPNTVDLELRAEDGSSLQLRARSVGGGAVEFTEVEGWPVRLTGNSYETLVVVESSSQGAAAELLIRDGEVLAEPITPARGGLSLVWVPRKTRLPGAVGQMLPRELRCTGLGGLAATPSARALKPRPAGRADRKARPARRARAVPPD